MAELEEAEHGAAGRVREWLARATRAPRDAAWVADGLVSDHWLPVSPISGRLDAFVWTMPPATLGRPAADLDDVLADLDESRRSSKGVSKPRRPEPAAAIVEAVPAATVTEAVAPAPTPAAAEARARSTPEAEPVAEPKPEPEPAAAAPAEAAPSTGKPAGQAGHRRWSSRSPTLPTIRDRNRQSRKNRRAASASSADLAGAIPAAAREKPETS